MQYPLLSLILLLGGHLFSTVTALVTLDTMRNLTALTDECRGRVIDGGGVVSGVSQQGLLREDGDEVEATVTAALRLLCSELLAELEKPISGLGQQPLSSKECQAAIKDYHTFLAATVKFFHEVQERQLKWRWGTDSTVFDGIGWMQGLWASRRANSQDRSFIEQQMSLYTATECFGKSKEVLRRDVEVVEYLNDLIDLF